MEKILLALKRAQRKKVGILQVLAWGIAMIASVACMPDGRWNVPVLLLFAGIAVAACIAIACRFLSARALAKSIKQMLPDEALAQRFFQSIDRELSQTLRTQLYNPQYRLQLYITESWFVLISTNASIMCSREDIRAASCQLDRRKSQFYIQLELADGRSWPCACHTVCQQLLQCIQEEMFP